MKILTYKRDLDDADRLAVTYYLLLQERCEEAGKFFEQVNADRLDTRLQYDYFAAYISLLHEDLEAADQIAARYLQHPVDRWRNSFRLVHSQIAEARGEAPEVLDQENRNQVQGQLASTEPSFEFKIKAEKVNVRYQHLERVSVNFYLMDIELLFSRQPFVQSRGGQFAYIRRT